MSYSPSIRSSPHKQFFMEGGGESQQLIPIFSFNFQENHLSLNC